MMKLCTFPFDSFPPGRPMVIAGPCSAESEKQMVATAQELVKQNIKIFRAGIWKPRTRPGSFEGYGKTALNWLQTVKEKTGMYVATEVANAKHLEDALNAGIDIIWIGARTTANPFSVQEIADALRGIDIPVIVKNPVNPDLELWIGAIERLHISGINRLAACHRGFSIFRKNKYRNDPNWQIPIGLKTLFPELPIITDPSHICGNRADLQSVSQSAMDLNFDGLMIECHCNPDQALSDPKQQITPKALGVLLNSLVIRQPDVTNGTLNTLQELRAQIDILDNTLIDCLARRMELATEIGSYKKRHNISILQSKRWEDILKSRVNTALKSNLSQELIETVFKAIHQESINRQFSVMNRLQE